MSESAATPPVPRLTYLRIRNYRVLRDVELRDLTPLTVLIGPNGSGKSTVLDALAFLAEAVSGNLQQAWEKRNRFAGMRTRGSEGPIEFEIRLSGIKAENELRYLLVIDSLEERIVVNRELLEEINKAGELVACFTLEITGGRASRFKVIDQESLQDEETDHPLGLGKGATIDGLSLATNESKVAFFAEINSPIKQLAIHFQKFIQSYRNIHLTDDHQKGYSDEGPREKLSANGDNLPNVLYYLHTKHPETLARITAKLRRWVPNLADIVTEITSDERLLLRFKDAPFEKPLPAQYMSGGTMRLVALLTLLYEPDAAGLLGLEEPENELHPRLLPRLAEELVMATETRQLFVATHSPAILDALDPAQVWILHRGPEGYAQATRTADLPNVPEMVEDGSPLGYLWSSNSLPIGDPLTPPAAR